MTQSVDRAVEALMYVANQPRSVSDVAERLGVHSTTALRILHTLHGWRLLEKRADGTYRLGAAALTLGQRALESLDIREVAAPFMQELHDVTGETVHLAILENGHVVYIDKIESKHPVRMYSRIGLVAPLHCTGVAKAILAHLPTADADKILAGANLVKHTPNTLTTPEELYADFERSRERGYAMDDQEHEIGIHCVAAAILHADGSVGASLSVSAPEMRVSREHLMTFVEPLRRAVAGAGSELGRTLD